MILAWFFNDTLKSDTSYIIDAIAQMNNSSGNFISDKLSWIKIESEYIATGDEEYITIGNFKRNIVTDTLFVSGVASPIEYGAYYYIDDVCVSRDSSYCNFPNGTDQLVDVDISIYPNPTNGPIKINIPYNSSFDLFIYNMLGELIYENVIRKSIELDISENPTGIYYIHLTSQANQKKIIKKIILYN